MNRRWLDQNQRSDKSAEQRTNQQLGQQLGQQPGRQSGHQLGQKGKSLINTAIKSLSKGLKLSSAEEHALRRYKAAVAELQAYSDSELAEFGIVRNEIFKFALAWQLDYDKCCVDEAA